MYGGGLMGTKISTPAEVASVKCPKKTGEMSEDTSCKECSYYADCMRAIMGAL